MKRAAMPVFLFLAPLVLWAAASRAAPPAEDPWKGKARSEIVELLGEPQKLTTREGEETWTYRLTRVAEGDLADPALTLLEVPGVGLVGRRSADEEGGRAGAVSVEPTMLDEDGHPTGGLTTTESRSISWSKDKGKVDTAEPPRGSSAKKIKLTFRLDATGHVVDWDVQPKSAVIERG